MENTVPSAAVPTFALAVAVVIIIVEYWIIVTPMKTHDRAQLTAQVLVGLLEACIWNSVRLSFLRFPSFAQPFSLI